MIERRYAEVKAKTDFWMYPMLWSKVEGGE